MNFSEIAELIGAFAAFVTLGMAVVELILRNRIKKAEEAMDMYANYLIAEQQVKYVVENALSFIDKLINMTDFRKKVNDCKAYAKAHMPDTSLVSLLQTVEKEGITVFDKKQTDQPKRVLEAIGVTTNLVTVVSTFYQTILDKSGYEYSDLRHARELIEQELKSFEENNQAVKVILAGEVKTPKRSAWTYVLVFFALTVLFVLACGIIGFGQWNTGNPPELDETCRVFGTILGL